MSAGKFYKESTHATLIPGENGKIYIDLATGKLTAGLDRLLQLFQKHWHWEKLHPQLTVEIVERQLTRSQPKAHARPDATKTEDSETNETLRLMGRR